MRRGVVYSAWLAVLAAGTLVQGTTGVLADQQPCANPIGDCGTQTYTHHGCYQDGATFDGAKATLDKYDPTLCDGNTPGVAVIAWWVMLNKGTSDWVQAGWVKGSIDDLGGDLALFWEENNTNQYPPHRRDFWPAAAGGGC